MAGLVTIFGGSGFIGRSLVRQLARRDWRIRVAVRRPSDVRALQPLGGVGQITPIAAKVQDGATVRRAVAGSDAVINLAGILFEKGSQTFEAVHAQGAANVAQAAAAAGVSRLVHMSALTPEGSISGYAKTKVRGEAAVREAFAQAAVVKPSVVFGPDDEFFNRFAAMALMSPFLPLVGGGKTKFQPVYVGDVASAITTCLEEPAAAGRSFELGGPGVYSFRELLVLMLEAIGRKRILMPLSYDMASAMAWPMEFLPKPPLTRDQVILLKRDNLVNPDAEGFAELGIDPSDLEAIVPGYLDCYRVGGPYRPLRA